jgi:hydroxymethylpyrimidine/phosphomethylpyrimidine kinase
VDALTVPVALTIAGVDSGGGAGVAADLKTFEAHGVWGACAVAAVTAQNTVGVQDVAVMAPELVRRQIESVVTDIGVDAAKTGMLGSASVVSAVVAAVRDLGLRRLVVDPVLASSTGAALLDEPAALLELLALATVATPNRDEARMLTGCDDPEDAARALLAAGAQVVMVTGSETARDLVLAAGAEPVWLNGRRLDGPSTHGTGCVLSAAVAAELARGMEPADACVAAKRFVERAIAAGLPLGGGVGPVNPGWERSASAP